MCSGKSFLTTLRAQFLHLLTVPISEGRYEDLDALENASKCSMQYLHRENTFINIGHFVVIFTV